MTRIARMGITVQDRICSLPTPSEGDRKHQVSHYLEIGGGPAITAVVVITKFGVEVDFIGHTGDNNYRNTLLVELEGWGVNTTFCRRCPSARSS